MPMTGVTSISATYYSSSSLSNIGALTSIFRLHLTILPCLAIGAGINHKVVVTVGNPHSWAAEEAYRLDAFGKS